MTDSVTLRLRIEGRVQGVSYRAWAEREAQARDLRGWVRNCRDGSVEALVHGPRAQAEAFAEACRQGPPAAAVSEVTAKEAGDPVPDGFEVRETA
jgi:acylphosphatase